MCDFTNLNLIMYYISSDVYSKQIIGYLDCNYFNTLFTFLMLEIRIVSNELYK